MSHAPSPRKAPRASVRGHTLLFPALTAGLVTGSAIVWTRPPLSASAASLGSTIVGPQVPSLSIEFKTDWGRSEQSAPRVPSGAELSVTIEFRSMPRPWAPWRWLPSSVMVLAGDDPWE